MIIQLSFVKTIRADKPPWPHKKGESFGIHNAAAKRDRCIDLKQLVSIATDWPHLVKNVTEFLVEPQKGCPWANTAYLQTELLAHCDPVTFWTKT